MPMKTKRHPIARLRLVLACLLPLTALSACNSADDENCTKNVCLDDNTLAVCDPQTGSSTPKTCKEGCQNNACKEDAPTTRPASCQADVCRDAHILDVCNTKTGTTSPKPCPFGCAANACKADPNAPDNPTTPGDPQNPDKPKDPPLPDNPEIPDCIDDLCLNENELGQCNAQTGKITRIPCEYGCQNKTCNPKPDVPKDPEPPVIPDPPACTADLCLNQNELGQCDAQTGKITQTPCKHGCQNKACIEPNPESYKIGDPCTPSEFSEYCLDNAAIFCNSSGFVEALDCDAIPEKTCATLYNFYGGNIHRASCFDNSDKCKFGEKRQRCIDYENASIIGTQICFKASGDEYYFDWSIGNASPCADENSRLTSCLNAFACNDAPRAPQCDAIHCNADLGYASCTETQHGGACYTQTCDNDQIGKLSCDTFAENQWASQICLAALDGKSYLFDIQLCQNACDNETGKCL